MRKRRLEPETMSVPEAGELLGVGRGSAYKYARAGEIPVIRMGRRLLVLREQLEKMLYEPAKRTRENA
jgi:excisionase family DNA binding protein